MVKTPTHYTQRLVPSDHMNEYKFSRTEEKLGRGFHFRLTIKPSPQIRQESYVL